MTHVFRVLVNFQAFTARIARMVRMKPDNSQQVVSISLDLYNAYLKNGLSFADAVARFLDLCFTIDKVKIQATGYNAPTDVTNTVHTTIAHIMSRHIEPTPWEMEWLDKFVKDLESSQSSDNWCAPKVKILYHAFLAVDETRRFVAGLNLNNVNPDIQALVEDARGRTDEFRGEISGMMGRLLELRRYGIKPAYFTMNAIQTPGRSWVIWDHRDFRAANDRRTWIRNQFAQIALSSKKDLESLKVEQEEVRLGSRTEMTTIKIPFDWSFTWTMDRDAEFDISPGLSASPVRDMFVKSGKELEYEMLRFHLWLRLYDLVVPLETVLQMPDSDAKGRTGVVGKLVTLVTGKSPASSISDLFLPRVLSLDNLPSLTSQLEREVEESEKETERRALRKHEVTAHIRRLPPGRKASPDARRLASEEFGIELADGETFVRKHDRGDGKPEITSHRVRTRGHHAR